MGSSPQCLFRQWSHSDGISITHYVGSGTQDRTGFHRACSLAFQVSHLVVYLLSKDPPQGRNAARHCKEGIGVLHSIEECPVLCPNYLAYKNTTEELTGQRGHSLQTMLSTQSADSHSLGGCRSCQVEGTGCQSKGEKWGSTWLIWGGRRCSRGLWKGQGGKARRREGWSQG